MLVPSPGYPVYPVGTSFAGGISHLMPLTKQNGFLPDLKAIPKDVAKKAKLMFLNSPNNPTSVIMSKDYFKRVVAFAQENQVIVCHDAAYSEIFYDGKPPASFMEVDGAKEVGIEFHSLSKTYNMTGWRIGFAVGHKTVLAGLGKVKSNLDSGCFQAMQAAGITALGLDDSVTDGLRKIYQERRDTLVPGLKKLGLEVDPPPAAFYIWVTVPKGYTSASFTAHLAGESRNRHDAGQRIRRAGRRVYSNDRVYIERAIGGGGRADKKGRVLGSGQRGDFFARGTCKRVDRETMSRETVYIGFGSNVGESRRFLRPHSNAAQSLAPLTGDGRFLAL